jgi:hypothetical protein
MPIGFSLINAFEGSEGQVIVPGLGAVVCTISKWSMRRKGDNGPFIFRGSLTYFNAALFNNEDLTKHVIVKMTRDKQYRVRGDRLAVSNNTLLMENAELCLPE